MLNTNTFQVVGDPRMHCASCEQRVARVLGGLEGVRQVSADAASQRIEVLFDTSVVQAAAIAEHLQLLGYAVKSVPAQPSTRG